MIEVQGAFFVFSGQTWRKFPSDFVDELINGFMTNEKDPAS
jgi:hypothetical protein